MQTALNDLKISMKKLNECHGIFQFPIDVDTDTDAKVWINAILLCQIFENCWLKFINKDEHDFKKKSRFNLMQRYKKSKIKHKDDKELLKTLHGKIWIILK